MLPMRPLRTFMSGDEGNEHLEFFASLKTW